MNKLLVLFFIIVLAGCQTSKNIYYWGDYSETAYQYKHEPSAETYQEHMHTLEEIINTAKSRNKKIPPGIYVELATLYASAEKTDQAKAMLQKEQELFPESAQFIKLVNNKLIGAAL